MAGAPAQWKERGERTGGRVMTDHLRGAADQPLAGACPIEWQAPPDGGTPRDPARIVSVGPCAFRIRAGAEEGNSPLTHAVSRLDLICRNSGSQPVTVTLHLDLSGDGGRTNRDDSPYGAMSSRDFLFIQPPGEPWRQVNGTTEGWICTVSFAALPGETRVGLSPWYTYGDYLAFVRSLPEHAHLDLRLRRRKAPR